MQISRTQLRELIGDSLRSARTLATTDVKAVLRVGETATRVAFGDWVVDGVDCPVKIAGLAEETANGFRAAGATAAANAFDAHVVQMFNLERSASFGVLEVSDD